MTKPPKKRFPKKKPVDDLTTDDIMRRVFPKKVREELEKTAHKATPKQAKAKRSND